MTKKIKIMTIFGTRPEAIKLAPVILELTKHSEIIESIVTVTAQHREMLDQVLLLYNIKPNFDLDIMKEKQLLPEVAVNALSGLDFLLKKVQPDLVLVHGDTSTTFVASMAAFYNKISVAHVEAGLRTRSKYSPFPEEIHRQLTGVIADLHFSPTTESKENLLQENKKKDSILVTGNTAIDALKTTISKSFRHELLETIGSDKIILLTTHRRENIGEPMRNVFKAIKRLLVNNSDIQIIFPVHLNPYIREIAHEMFDNNNRVHLIEPLGVLEFHNFLSRSYLVLTDSGGVQEEAPSLGVPVLVIRDTTERIEGVNVGALTLVGTDEETIFNTAHELLNDKEKYNAMAKIRNPYGDGKASYRIVQEILKRFGKIENGPDEFQ